MTRLFGICSLLALLLALLLAQCGTVTPQSGTMPQQVTMHADNLSLTLAGESFISSEQVESARLAGANLKVIPDELLQALVQEFEARGFRQMAKDRPDPRAKTWIEVHRGDGTRFASAVGDVQFTVVEFVQIFNVMYNDTEAFQTADISGDEFQRASEALNRSSQAGANRKIKKR